MLASVQQGEEEGEKECESGSVHAQFDKFLDQHKPQIWSLVLEKAFAVHAGGWDKLVMGRAEVGLVCLTGCTETFSIRNSSYSLDPSSFEYVMKKWDWSAYVATPVKRSPRPRTALCTMDSRKTLMAWAPMSCSSICASGTPTDTSSVLVREEDRQAAVAMTTMTMASTTVMYMTSTHTHSYTHTHVHARVYSFRVSDDDDAIYDSHVHDLWQLAARLPFALRLRASLLLACSMRV